MTRIAITVAALVAAAALGAATLASAGDAVSTSTVTCSEKVVPKLPSGKPLRLSGVWTEDEANPWYVRQLGSCLWLLGKSKRTQGMAEGANWMLGVFAQIRPNLAIRGVWTNLPPTKGQLGGGSMSGAVRFKDGAVTLDFGDGFVMWQKKACRTNNVC